MKLIGLLIGLAAILCVGAFVLYQKQNKPAAESSISMIYYDWNVLNFSNQASICAGNKEGSHPGWKYSTGANYTVEELGAFLESACKLALVSTTEAIQTTDPPLPQPLNTVSSSGIASQDLWISGYEMAQPPCDGSFITIVASVPAVQVIEAMSKFNNARYLKTLITCDSLNPYFTTEKFAGQPKYAVFFGPYSDRYEAQDKCLALGLTKMIKCAIAPLTDSESDRKLRYGPTD